MRHEFSAWVCDDCGTKSEGRVMPDDWFKIDIYTRCFASMRERHFCPSCGGALATLIDKGRPALTQKDAG